MLRVYLSVLPNHIPAKNPLTVEETKMDLRDEQFLLHLPEDGKETLTVGELKQCNFPPYVKTKYYSWLHVE